jgi:uncharacterized protein
LESLLRKSLIKVNGKLNISLCVTLRLCVEYAAQSRREHKAIKNKEMENTSAHKIGPVKSSERHAILDILRGIALFGICLANYPEFSLYTFQKKEIVEAMPTAAIDHIWRFMHYIFIDGKFYSLFSLLFGIGFSIIISNIAQKYKNCFTVFYRRMLILSLIGIIHLIFLWAGDIVLLYALIGFLLPMFQKLSDKKLLIFSAVLILSPVITDTFKVITDHGFTLMIPVNKALNYFNMRSGITDDNFGVWLLNGKTYSEILQFNMSGVFIRCQEFIEGSRVVKVSGLFILGLYIGRNRLYARLGEHVESLKKIRNYGFLWGIPVSCLFAWNEVNSHPMGLIASAAIYAVSVVPLSFAYISAVGLLYLKYSDCKIFKIMAAPGRMALTNYIMQSVAGMIIFYGIGFGLALKGGLIRAEMIAVAVFMFQVLFSNIWLRLFQYGPLEWIWRMFTYLRWLKIRK